MLDHNFPQRERENERERERERALVHLQPAPNVPCYQTESVQADKLAI
jgi:hypothetical protein